MDGPCCATARFAWLAAQGRHDRGSHLLRRDSHPMRRERSEIRIAHWGTVASIERGRRHRDCRRKGTTDGSELMTSKALSIHVSNKIHFSCSKQRNCAFTAALNALRKSYFLGTYPPIMIAINRTQFLYMDGLFFFPHGDRRLLFVTLRLLPAGKP